MRPSTLCGSFRPSSDERPSRRSLHRGQTLPPRERRIGDGEELRIQDRLLRVVPEDVSVEGPHGAASGLEDRLRRRDVPFGGRSEPRIEVRRSLGEDAELERAAERRSFDRAERGLERFEEALEALAAMAAAGDDRDRPLLFHGARAEDRRLPLRSLLGVPRGDVPHVNRAARRYTDDTEHGPMILDERDVDRELPVA
jgi:hypothetical protein